VTAPSDGAKAEQRVRDLLDRHEIQDALLRYCRGVDRKDFSMMASAYHADAYDDHGGYRGDIPGLIEWVRAGHEAVEQSQHFLANCLIEINGDVAVVETYGIVLQRMAADPAQPDRLERRHLTFSLRYLDRFERRANGWRIAERVTALETVKIEVRDPAVPDGVTVGSRGPQDPLWRLREAAGLPGGPKIHG
jgi:SnoaL-like domain